jgi:hypothetical protein
MGDGAGNGLGCRARHCDGMYFFSERILTCLCSHDQ